MNAALGSTRLWLVFVAAIGVMVGEGRAEAGDRELARQRYVTGTMLYERGRFADALADFERGKQAEPRPEFDYNIARCLEKMGRAAEAADAYERFLLARPQDPEAEALRVGIARLRQSAPPSPAPPVATAPPAAMAPSPAVVAAPAVLAAAAPPPSPARRRGSFLGSARGRATLAIAGVGAAAFVTAAITGGVALTDRDAYRAGCMTGRCDDASYDGGRHIAIATDVLLGVGVVAAVTATAIGLSRPRERRVAIAPSAGTHAAGLSVAGEF